VNVNYRYVEEELKYLFNNADLKAIFYDEEFGPRIAAVKDSLPLLKTLVIIYTGGTTGMPKGVMWRSEDIFFALAGGIDPFTRRPVESDREHADKARE